VRAGGGMSRVSRPEGQEPLAAAAIATGIFSLFGGQHPDALTDTLARGSWLAGAAFPGPALIAWRAGA
jgi:hypothetical protein